MRSGSVALVCFLLLASAVMAGGSPHFNSGMRQIIFEFNGLGTMGLDTYAGGLGMRIFLNDEGMAGRGSVNAGYRTEEENSDKTTVSLIGGSLLLEKFVDPIGSVAPYLGIGAGYFYSTQKQPTTDGEAKTTRAILEVPAVAGFQWWFTDGVSLGGEYRCGIRYTRDKYYLEGFGIGDSESFSTGFYAASVFLTILI
jgi:opacity protein-like surface antigen